MCDNSETVIMTQLLFGSTRKLLVMVVGAVQVQFRHMLVPLVCYLSAVLFP